MDLNNFSVLILITNSEQEHYVGWFFDSNKFFELYYYHHIRKFRLKSESGIYPYLLDYTLL